MPESSVSPYILRAAMRAERLEKELAANDCAPKENGGSSTFDEKAAAMPKKLATKQPA